MDFLTVLLIIHIIGSVLGTGSATMLEVFLNKSLLDGKIDPIEGSFMKTTATVLRVGLVISVYSGLMLILLYRFNDQIHRLYDPVLWAKFTILFIVLLNALQMQARKLDLKISTAISFTSWWFILILGFLASGPAIPYMTVMFYYALALILIGFILNYIRKLLGINI